MATDKDSLSKAEYLSLTRMIGSENTLTLIQLKMGYTDPARLMMAAALVPEGYEVARVIKDAVRH